MNDALMTGSAKPLQCRDTRECFARREDYCLVLIECKNLPPGKRFYEDGACPFCKVKSEDIE